MALECCCVGMALCRNGDMSGYVLLGYVLNGDEQHDDPILYTAHTIVHTVTCIIACDIWRT